MKKIILLAISVIFFGSCNSSDAPKITKNKLTNKAEAKQEFDDSSYGIYKGIFICGNSSGTIYINLNNDGNVFSELTIDNITTIYKTKQKVTQNTDLNKLTFFNNDNSFVFRVSRNGERPIIEKIKIKELPNANIQIFKEYSFSHVKCYLGSFKGNASRKLNIATTSDGSVLGIATSEKGNSTIEIDGSVKENEIMGTFEDGTFSGTIQNNEINGAWQNSSSQKMTWISIRKL